jgi:drug/metabolite transporter (DMT)-like permease
MKNIPGRLGYTYPRTPSDQSTVGELNSTRQPSTRASNLKQVDPQQSFLDVPAFRPSLDSTYSELSELSIQSNELHHNIQPLIRTTSRENNNYKPTNPTSRFRAAWDSFLEVNYGALLVLASQGFGTGMTVSTRLLEIPGPHGAPMHPFQILFVRQSITALICTVYGFYTKSIPDFPWGPKGIRWLLVLRGVFGFFGVFGMYFSLLYLPLSEATVLGFLVPILTCYVCSFILPTETFTVQQQVAGFVSLAGVLVIARPSSFFSGSATAGHASDVTNSASNSTMPATSAQQPTPEQHLAAVGVAMLGVVGGTVALSAIRVMGTKVHAFISINYFSVWCSLVSLFCLVVFPDVKFRVPGNFMEWALLINLGLCGFVMQFLLTAGLAYGGPSQEDEDVRAGQKTGDVESPERGGKTKSKRKSSGTRATAMCYTQILFALTGDKLVFGATPDTMSWIGSGLILAGAVWVSAARDETAKNEKDQKRDSGFRIPGFGLLRRQSMPKVDIEHEEATALMVDDIDEDDDLYEERPQSHDDKMTEAMEMHEMSSGSSQSPR